MISVFSLDRFAMRFLSGYVLVCEFLQADINHSIHSRCEFRGTWVGLLVHDLAIFEIPAMVISESDLLDKLATNA